MNKMDELAIEAKELTVVYKKGLGRHDLTAVDNLNLQVRKGEVVGFIGPNGAGKTTTIKVLMGFIHPTMGQVRVLEHNAGSIEAKKRIGYLPEVALYYPFMKAGEILNMYGGLMGFKGQELEQRVDNVLEMVGLKDRGDVLLRRFSKGMLQRIGIAQAVMGEPALLILDEVTSGLDPVGRRDLRQLLLNFKQQGKTIFFSSHELSEVSLICDRVIIIDEGKVIEEKKIGELMIELSKFHLTFRSPTYPEALPFACEKIKEDLYRINITDEQKPIPILQEIINRGYEIVEFAADSLSLEDYFVKTVGRKIT